MSGKYALGPVDLFRQHAPNQQVRPGHGAETHYPIGAFDDRVVETVGAADQERHIPGLIAPIPQFGGEGRTRQGLAALV